MFHIAQSYVDGPRRLERATMVSSHPTALDALAELERVGAAVRRFGIPANALELIVVTDDRRPVPRWPDPGFADVTSRARN